MTNKWHATLAVSIVAFVALSLPGTGQGDSVREITVPIRYVGGAENGQPVDGSFMRVAVSPGEVSMSIRSTGFDANEALTLWFVFNENPEACTGYPNVPYGEVPPIFRCGVA